MVENCTIFSSERLDMTPFFRAVALIVVSARARSVIGASGSALLPNTFLSSGDSLQSKNLAATLTLTTDGDLVLTETSVISARPSGTSTKLWHSGTSGHPGDRCYMQDDGWCHSLAKVTWKILY